VGADSGHVERISTQMFDILEVRTASALHLPSSEPDLN
jgi:hypothetical protein